MTHGQKLATLMNAGRLLNRKGIIAGGFVRDCVFNKVPKDMDILVPLPAWAINAPFNPDYFVDVARGVMAVFGLEPDVPEFIERQGVYGNIGHNRKHHFLAIKSLGGMEPGGQPIDVIFSEGFEVDTAEEFINDKFDLDICKGYIEPNGLINAHQMIQAKRQRYQLLSNRGGALDMIDRVSHLSAKYPWLKVRVDGEGIGWNTVGYVLRYAQMKGVLDYAAGEILQAEGPGIAWDEVGLNNREGGGAALRGLAQANV